MEFMVTTDGQGVRWGKKGQCKNVNEVGDDLQDLSLFYVASTMLCFHLASMVPSSDYGLGERREWVLWKLSLLRTIPGTGRTSRKRILTCSQEAIDAKHWSNLYREPLILIILWSRFNYDYPILHMKTLCELKQLALEDLAT